MRSVTGILALTLACGAPGGTSMKRIAAFLIGVMLVGSARTQTKATCPNSTVDAFGPGQASKARAFLARLKVAAAARDSRALSALIEFPLRLNIGNGRKMVSDRAAFLTNSEKYFSPGLRSAIAEQSEACLFGNWQGVMIGSGELWFRVQADGSYKVHAINISAEE